jgi:iron complex transport system permease protein
MKAAFSSHQSWQKTAFIFWLLSSLLILLFGHYPTLKALNELFGFKARTSWNPVIDERIPRWIILSLSGSSLAMAGAAMQALFNNTLASPSSLGITAGGSLMIVIAYTTGLASFLTLSTSVLAFLGCLITLVLVYSLSLCRGGSSSATLVLIGLAIATLMSAIESSLMYWVRDDWNLVRTLTEWAAASTFDCTWTEVWLELPFCILGSLGIWWLKHEIDIMSLGEEQAIALGIDTEKVRWLLFLCISLITGSTLASLGSLPFFGLLLPHLARLITGPAQKKLLPLCLWLGAGILCFLDWLIRYLQLGMFSLGNVCALLGAVGFLFIFFQQRQRLYD